MSDHTFDLGELQQHISSMDDLSSQVQSTISTAQKQPNPLMYGVMMSPLVLPVMTAITTAGGQFLNGLTKAVDTASGQLEESRKAYAATEGANADGAQGMVV